jgi:transcription elongation factor Elf1
LVFTHTHIHTHTHTHTSSLSLTSGIRVIGNISSKLCGYGSEIRIMAARLGYYGREIRAIDEGRGGQKGKRQEARDKRQEASGKRPAARGKR